MKNEPQIGRKPIKADFMFFFNFVKMINKRGFYAFNLFKNESQIGRRPIKGIICFKFNFVEKPP